MTTILLIYPFFKPRWDRSVFQFPPLGISYLAAGLIEAGHDVRLLDCTFLRRKDALKTALETGAEVVGIYCMATMEEDCRLFARALRPGSRLLMAGGPLPTCDPDSFLDLFDVVVCGEGEQTVNELIQALIQKRNWKSVPGIAYRRDERRYGKEIIRNEPRGFIKDLDRIPFPARQLLPNEAYIRYGKKKYGYSITTVMSTRGCPFQCEFCSNVVFGGSYRERSAANVVNEIESVLALGYDRISFADDVFTLKKERVMKVCREIHRRKLNFQWECLGRVDTMDEETAREMKRAGCRRIYFGIESGDERILRLMNKKITPAMARKAVETAHRAGLEVGAFFILFYPGDTNESVAATLRYATALPADYLGLSMPYPLPGTALYERTKHRITRSWRPGGRILSGHILTYAGDFSEVKMQFGIFAGQVEFALRRRLGTRAPMLADGVARIAEFMLRIIR